MTEHENNTPLGRLAKRGTPRGPVRVLSDARMHSTAPLPAPSRRRLPVVAAAVLVLALGAAAVGIGIALNGNDGEDVILPVDSTTSVVATQTTMPGTTLPPADQAAVEACHAQAVNKRARIDDLPDDQAMNFPRVVDLDQAEVKTFHDPNTGDIAAALLFEESLKLECRFLRDGAIDIDIGRVVRPILTPPDHFLYSFGGGSSGRLEGSELTPVDTEVVRWGTVGADVTHITLAHRTETPLEALIEDGWFYVAGPVPDGTDVEQLSFLWTLTDGTQRTAQTDDLREANTFDDCIATPGCYQETIDELIAQAAQLDDERQTLAIGGGIVRDSDREAATRRLVECLQQAGRNVEFIDGVVLMDVESPGLEGEAADAADEECARIHTDYVSQAYQLAQALRRRNAIADPREFSTFASSIGAVVEEINSIQVLIMDDPTTLDLPTSTEVIDDAEAACADIIDYSDEHTIVALAVAEHTVCIRLNIGDSSHSVAYWVDGISYGATAHDDCSRPNRGVNTFAKTARLPSGNYVTVGQVPARTETVVTGPAHTRTMSPVAPGDDVVAFWAAIAAYPTGGGTTLVTTEEGAAAIPRQVSVDLPECN